MSDSVDGVDQEGDLTQDPGSLSQSANPEGKTPKRRRKKVIVVGVLVAVIVIVIGGFQIWHQQPSFCSAICHTPMNSYVEGFDKDDDSILVSLHRREGNLECLDCHKATLGEQVSEAGKWITGNYTIPLEDSRIGTTDFCLECHGTYAELAEETADLDPPFNPHESHYEELDCYQCHSMHGTPEYFCTSCHQGLKLPEGWDAAPMY